MSPSTSPSFANYRRRMKSSSMPCLGELCWYTVAEALKIKHAAFLALCTQHGLEEYAPKMPKDVDVFRRACTKAQRKRVPVPNTDVFENIMVRDVKSAAGHFWKHIVVETVDGDNRRLDHEAVIEVHFDPDTPDALEFTHLMTHRSTAVQEVAQAIGAGYTEWRGMVYGYSVREFIRAVVMSTGATVVRPSGGVYFVMEPKLDTIAKLDEIVTHFAEKLPDGDLILHTVPLIDDARQREMLRAAVEAETAADIDKFVKEIDELLADDRATDARFAELASRKNALKAKTEEYATLLSDTLGGTELRMKKLESSLKRFYRAIG